MRILTAALGLLLLASCAGPSGETRLVATDFNALPDWRSDRHAEALHVFADACRTALTKQTAYETSGGEPIGTRMQWVRVCSEANQLVPSATDDSARAFFESQFIPYQVGSEREPLAHITGYYEPLLKGSMHRHDQFQTPVYGVPPDLKPGMLYYSRAEIDAGALNGKAPVLLYVADPVMLFFLQVQGSGQIELENGHRVSLHYAARNNEPYRPIGAILKARGMDNVSMGAIREWLAAHPKEAQDILEQNPCYIFFRLGPGEESAKGALGLPLVPGRSAAIDAARAAYGVPLYVAASTQDPRTQSTQPFTRLLIAEDTGSALSGPHRIDIFFGQGADAEWQAGHQNVRGNVYWLLPKP